MRKLMGAALLMTSVTAYSAAPVEDLGSQSPPAAAGATPAVEPSRQVAQGAGQQPVQSGGQQALVNLHYELQEMREELRQLRGVVEEQGHELRQLRQRQMDDYQDLDRRLSVLSGTAPSAGAAVERGASSDTALPGPGSEAEETPDFRPVQREASASQRDEYEEIFNRLKARKIDEAQAGFKTFVAKYPQSPYSANAWYWLGEIYLLQNELGGAEEAFERVTSDFPAHSKAPDAKFKLGKVYHLQGKNDQAKALLTDVANGDSRSAALAQTYLRDNF